MNICQVILGAALLATPLLSAAQTARLQRVTPESQGVRSQVVMNYIDSMMSLPRTDIHSIVLLRHGKVIAEVYPAPFAASYRHTLYSCSKTFAAAAVGIAIGEGRLRVTDRIGTFLADCLPDTVSTNLADITVQHLLTMSSGIMPDWQLRSICDDWTPAMLRKPVDVPGRKFRYDSLCTYLLSVIVQRATGQTLIDYLRQRLFAPMGITEAEWEVSPEGYCTAGWGLRLCSESLAKFGQLLLQNGCWEGHQLIPAAWVKDMMSRQIDNGEQGYGYQMWLCERPGTARADGAYGQLIYVVPDADMVAVVTQCSTGDFKRQRRLLFTAIDRGTTATALPESRAAKTLAKRAAAYVLPTAEGRATSRQQGQLLSHRLVLDENRYGWKSVQFDRCAEGLSMTVTDSKGATTRIICTHHRWTTVSTMADPVYSITAHGRLQGITRPFHVAASYGWGAGSTLNVKLNYVDLITPLTISVTPHTDGAVMHITQLNEKDEFTINGRWSEGE